MIEIWGVVNVTPDSFSDGGTHAEPGAAIDHARRLASAGATVLDVGGESTRPGARPVGVDEEIRRTRDVVAALAADGLSVSIDTYRAETAAAAVAAGARIVNDVSGGLADPEILSAVAETTAEYAIGHWRGPSSDMYARAQYRHVAREVAAELSERAEAALAAGIPAERIIVDPGVGFAKTAAQNWELLRDLAEVTALGHRVLIGTSRKRFLETALGESPAMPRRDLATAVTSVLAARSGVYGVRVHDPAATRDALAVAEAWEVAR